MTRERTVSIWAELKRRKVVQVAAVYAVTTWLLVQVVVAVETPLNLPDWVDSLVIVLLAVGFPVALILSWAFDVTPTGVVHDADGAPPAAAARPSAHWLTHASQTLVLLAVGFLVADQYWFDDDASAASAPAHAPELQRLSIVTPAESPVAFGWYPALSLAISPDGTAVAYVADSVGAPSSRQHLRIRSLDSLSARPLQGTDGAAQPFFSPDGRWLAFFTADGALKKVPVAGGSAVTLADGISAAGWGFGVWLENDVIVFGMGGAALQRVSADGGAVSVLAEAHDADANRRRFATDFVPGTDVVLVQSSAVDVPARQSIEAVRLATGERQVITADGGAAKYLPSGHLLFKRDDVDVVAPFDSEQLALTGPAVPLVDAIRRDGGSIMPQLAVSRSGTLAFVPPTETRRSLVAVARDGAAEALRLPYDYYAAVDVSPNGQYAALEVRTGPGAEIRIYDFARQTLTGLARQGSSSGPAWHPAGRALAVVAARAEQYGLFEVDLNGAERLLVPLEGTEVLRSGSWHPDGRTLAYTRQLGDQYNLWTATIGDEIERQPLTATDVSERTPRFSPDGRWLAYVAGSGADSRVYVRKYPVGDALVVSRERAGNPRWSADGAELFFLGRHDTRPMMLAVTVAGEGDGDTAEIGPVVPLFPLAQRNERGEVTSYEGEGVGSSDYAVLPDGRFLMMQRLSSEPQTEIVLVQGWLDEVRRLTAASP